jgi:hypothetical protein
MPVITNQRGPSGYITLRATGSDGILRVDAGGSVQGANATATEVVSNMRIVHAMWSVSGTNTWSVNRGSNTVLVLAGSGSHDYSGEGFRLESDVTQTSSNVKVILSGGTGTLLLKLHKESGE